MGYYTIEDTIKEAYNSVRLFNGIAGNLDNVTPESIDNQLGYIFEELTETIDAVETGDDLELLDGVCDLFVTVAGLVQKLEVAGFDVAGALKKVNDNNLSKFPNLVDCDANIHPENTVAVLNCKYEVVIFKDMDTGKIKKPTNFVPVNLSGFEVAGFLSGFKGGV